MTKIPLFYPFIPRHEIMAEIGETLSGRWLGQGPKVKIFEQMFAEKFNYQYCLMTNSGTSALELVYHMLNLRAGDEVIVPVLDCTAGQMGLIRRGVKIVFADIKEDLTVCPRSVYSKITHNTKAIVGVNLGGISCDPEVHEVAKKFRIPYIVDASQDHRHCEGDYICYSFQAIKHITTADGGMLVLNDESDYNKAKLLRWFGIDRELKESKNYQAWERREMTFDITYPGYKYQPTDIDACFGIASLPHLDEVIEHRQQLVKTYLQYLPECVTTITGGSCWLMGILTDRRDELAEYLDQNGIETNLVHLRNDIFKVFGGERQNLPMMDMIEPCYLYLPLNTTVTEKDVVYICNTIKKFFYEVL